MGKSTSIYVEPNSIREVDQLLASEEARTFLRKAARVATAGFPMEIDDATRRRLSPVAIKACNKVDQFWRLGSNELASLIAMTPVDYGVAKASPRSAFLDPAQFARAGLLIEICLTLARLLDEKPAYEWLHLPNAAQLFGSRSPIELMQSGGLETMTAVLGHLFACAQGLQVQTFDPDQSEP